MLFIVWDDPLISIGSHTFIADALRLSGGVSVIDVEQNWPHVGLEHVVRMQPEFLVFTGDHGDGEAAKIDELRDEAGVARTRGGEGGPRGVHQRRSESSRAEID